LQHREALLGVALIQKKDHVAMLPKFSKLTQKKTVPD
jgi:hypothetical protein